MKKILLIMMLFFKSVIVIARQDFDIAPAETSGRGGACNASLNTPESIFYNPANLYQIKNTILSLSYNKYFVGFESDTGIDASEGYYPVDVDSYYLSLITPAVNTGTLGFAFSSVAFTELLSIYKFYASFSTELNKLFNIKNKSGIGAVGKYLLKEYGQTVYDNNDSELYISGFALDVGAHIIFTENLYLGVSIINLLSTDTGFYTEDIYDSLYRAGILYRLNNSSVFKSIDLLLDFEYIKSYYNFYSGVDININKSFSLRAGINFDYIGMGISYSFKNYIKLNCAVNYYINDFNGNILNYKINISGYF